MIHGVLIALLLLLAAPAFAADEPLAPKAAAVAAAPAVEAFPTPLAAPLARICLAMAIVSGAGFALAWWSRRRHGGLRGAGTRIDVLASRSLGSRHQVVLLEVGERRLLVGTGGDTICTLADLTETEAFSAALARQVPEGTQAPELIHAIGRFEGLDA